MLENLAINPTHLFVQAAGFLLLFFLLSKFFFGPIGQVLDEREHRVKEKMDEAERNSLEMQKMRDEYQQRIGSIETETRDRIQQAMKEALSAKDELLENAKNEAERLMDRSREEISLEKKKSLMELRDKVADLAILAAEKLIEKSIDDKAHRDLIDDIIEHGVKPV